MKRILKKNIMLFIFGLICFIGGITFIAYAGNYNSEEISYDNRNSHAEAENVKDAIDYLYSHGSCGEGMSCLENPIVVFNIVGPGKVKKDNIEITSLKIPINGSNDFKVIPDSGYTLHSISCDNGYILGSFKTLSTDATNPQEITITNPGVTMGTTCSIEFSTNEISITSTFLHTTKKSDICDEQKEGCVCWYIKNGGSNFTYGSHTGCNFKSTSCYYTYNNSGNFGCETLVYVGKSWCRSAAANDNGACSGVITCAT